MPVQRTPLLDAVALVDPEFQKIDRLVAEDRRLDISIERRSALQEGKIGMLPQPLGNACVVVELIDHVQRPRPNGAADTMAPSPLQRHLSAGATADTRCQRSSKRSIVPTRCHGSGGSQKRLA